MYVSFCLWELYIRWSVRPDTLLMPCWLHWWTPQSRIQCINVHHKGLCMEYRTYTYSLLCWTDFILYCTYIVIFWSLVKSTESKIVTLVVLYRAKTEVPINTQNSTIINYHDHTHRHNFTIKNWSWMRRRAGQELRFRSIQRIEKSRFCFLPSFPNLIPECTRKTFKVGEFLGWVKTREGWVENSCFPSFHLGRSGGRGRCDPTPLFLPQKSGNVRVL